MVITHVYNTQYWRLWFAGLPYLPVGGGNQQGKTAEEWCAEERAEVCYNLAMFNMDTVPNRKANNVCHTITYVKAKGCDVGYGGVAQRIKVSQGNECGGYKVGISDNVVGLSGGGTSRTRNGIGITDKGHIIIAQSSSRLTERNFCLEVVEQISKYWKDKVDLFLMEDGGGSTQMYSAITKDTFNPECGRPVATVTCVSRSLRLSFNRALKNGCTGEDVRLLQMILGELECDGNFGAKTHARLCQIQKILGVAADGCAGPVTYKALGYKYANRE